jgi:hypothetical protein
MASLKCAICDSSKAKSCGSCHSAAYCSTECQQTDWPLHKLVCKAFKSLPPRPDTSYKLAMLFPVDSKVPELIWINCKLRVDEDDGIPWEEAKIRKLLGDDNPFAEHKPVTRNVYRGFNLDHTIDISGRDTFLMDGSKRNQCVAEMTRGAMAHDWRGPIVMMRQPGTATDPRFYSDIILADLRTAVDYFLAYNSGRVVGSMFVRSTGLKVQGVRINCRGDQDVSGVEKYTAVDVPFDHPVFVHPKQPEISRLLGLPVLLRKYPPHRSWKEEPRQHVTQAVTFLNMDADPKSQSWGWAPMEWKTEVGSVILVRADGKAITPKHVDALCHYCQFKLQPVFEDSLGAGFVERTREDVLGFMTRKKFEAFFMEYKGEKMQGDPSWAIERSPYGI